VIPGLAVIWVIVIVLLLAFVLDRGLFRPIGRVMREREQAIRSARDLAQAASDRAAEATAEFERKTRAAQAEIYRQMDENRRQANEHRAALIATTREEVQASVTAAAARLDAQAAAAQARLEQEANLLAEAIVERVLDRKA
jgi:F0F1-type ATP synthase membrane subunit b/b'